MTAPHAPEPLPAPVPVPGAIGTAVPRISLCRGCCCGTPAKRPEVDHQGQRTRLAELAAAGLLRWRETECLGPCEVANVMVVHPTPSARAAGTRAVWLGRVGGDQLEMVVAWVAGGGPGHASVPDALHPHLIPAHGPTRRTDG